VGLQRIVQFSREQTDLRKENRRQGKARKAPQLHWPVVRISIFRMYSSHIRQYKTTPCFKHLPPEYSTCLHQPPGRSPSSPSLCVTESPSCRPPLSFSIPRFLPTDVGSEVASRLMHSTDPAVVGDRCRGHCLTNGCKLEFCHIISRKC
jgi:hypothetical protein